VAIADYTEAIRLDPKNPDRFKDRAESYDTHDQHDLGIADYTEAIRLDPENGATSPLRHRAAPPKRDFTYSTCIDTMHRFKNAGFENLAALAARAL
jgi:tetratricopeptide (TPR) repeat protein